MTEKAAMAEQAEEAILRKRALTLLWLASMGFMCGLDVAMILVAQRDGSSVLIPAFGLASCAFGGIGAFLKAMGFVEEQR